MTAGADTSCSVRPEGGEVDGVLETVARIGGKLLACEGGGEAAVVESLRELQRVRMTFEALEATKIGRAVNALRKTAPSEQARRLAAALYRGWKALADERLTSSRAQQQQSPTKADDEGINKRSSSPPPTPVNAKQQSARPPEGEREMAPTSVVVEATTPETKLHLNEGFDSAARVRKPTSIRVVNTNATGKVKQSRVTVVRRTAATPNPAPASNTARRNDGGPNSNQQANNCAATASHQGTNAAAKCVSPTGAAPSTTAKPPTALPKPVVGSSSGACKRKAETPMVFDEARLAKARARLRERYNEASAAKEKRKIKEIKAIDAQMEKKARQRPAGRVVRCAVAHGTGKQAPVPCKPRMPSRAF